MTREVIIMIIYVFFASSTDVAGYELIQESSHQSVRLSACPQVVGVSSIVDNSSLP